MTDTRAERARETREKAMRLARKHQPLRYITGSATSREAAETVPEKPTKRVQVLAFLLHRGTSGATDHQIQETLGMQPSTERPRRVELVDMGLVVDSGKRRETPSGREAVVWQASVHTGSQVTMQLGETP